MRLLKQTLRFKDYAFVGALAAQVSDPLDQIRWTLDPQHLFDLLQRHPDLLANLSQVRPERC